VPCDTFVCADNERTFETMLVLRATDLCVSRIKMDVKAVHRHSLLSEALTDVQYAYHSFQSSSTFQKGQSNMGESHCFKRAQ